MRMAKEMHTHLLMGMLLLVYESMTHFFEQQAPSKHHDMYDKFQRLSTKEFSGTTDPFVVECWIRSLEVHFCYLNMEDVDRFRSATYMLRDDASLWWEGSERGVNLATLTLVQFKIIFNEKYFIADIRGRLKKEFTTLRQETRLWLSSLRDLIGLSLCDGLRPTIRHDVMLVRATDYAAATACAFLAEQAVKDILISRCSARGSSTSSIISRIREFMGTPKSQGQQKPQGQWKKPRQLKPPQPGTPKPEERPQCKECNLLHFVKCMWGTYDFFIYEEEGHKAADCPKKKGLTVGRAYGAFADALSRKKSLIGQLKVQRPLQAEIQRFKLAVYARSKVPNLSTMTVQSTLKDRIREGQSSDEQLQKRRQRDESKGRKLYSEDDDIVRYQDQLRVPSGESLREVIMKEAHNTPYFIHPRSTKIYKDV
ncbi:uncharacterized protein LOC142541908 [Primulina tabacum]|uniref:uncharacterized protein LOC142541908 n=1 Tax=Primulina tabacum TaxID=48773 RepID=UPI003F5999F3